MMNMMAALSEAVVAPGVLTFSPQQRLHSRGSVVLPPGSPTRQRRSRSRSGPVAEGADGGVFVDLKEKLSALPDACRKIVLDNLNAKKSEFTTKDDVDKLIQDVMAANGYMDQNGVPVKKKPQESSCSKSPKTPRALCPFGRTGPYVALPVDVNRDDKKQATGAASASGALFDVDQMS